jgi:hypothetical protein
MKRTGNRGADVMPQETKVRCNGKPHTITVSAKGHLVRCHHSPEDWQRERNFVRLGGDPYRCTEVVRLFRQGMRNGGFAPRELPKGLQRAVSRLRQRRIEARQAGSRRGAEMLSQRTWRERPEGVQWLLDRVLHRRLGVPEHVHSVVSWRPHSDHYTVVLMSGERMLFEDWVAWDWATEIYRTGLAVLDDCLTLRLQDRRARPLRKPEPGARAVQVVHRLGTLDFFDLLVRLVPRRSASGYDAVPVPRRRRRVRPG